MVRVSTPGVLVVVLSFCAACTGSGNGTSGDGGAPPDLAPVGMQVRQSVNQLHVTHAPPGTELVAVDTSGTEQGRGTTDALGSLIFRKLPAGSGYVVKSTTAQPALTSSALTVMSVESSLPPQSFYSGQSLAPGFGYLKTRDGTTLSIFVALPGPPEKGPYPTVVAYSGYNPSQPGDPVQSATFLCDEFPILCAPPSDPFGLVAGLLGFATVSVNIRGTGCSGGAYDFFETLESLDGYDVIETVAAQPWVLGHRVGMVGLSYPGMAQLWVAATQPPSLAAIAPLSTIGNPSNTLLPGGLLNDGFALEWINQVIGRADPWGQGWEKPRALMGDAVCGENQLLHGQKVNNVATLEAAASYDPAVDDALNPVTFVGRIKVPVFLSGGWQDEQTGPFFTELLDKFTGAPVVRLTMYNGVHPDGFQPQILAEWKAFFDLFLTHARPGFTKGQHDAAPLIFAQVFHATVSLPDDRWGAYQGYDDALAAYMKEPSVRVLLDEGGAGGLAPLGSPSAPMELHRAAWPPPDAQPTRFYLHADGSLGTAMPVEPSAASRYLEDPAHGEAVNLMSGADPWALLPAWTWGELAPTRAASFVSDALASDLLLLGTSSADLVIRSSGADADVQVTLSEVRADGQEMFLQAGWLRASYRKTRADATVLWPALSLQKADIAPLVPGQWTPVRVPIPAVGHVLRAGSRLRVTVDTPGGTRTEWKFHIDPASTFAVDVGHDQAHPSSVVLSVIPGFAASSKQPPCPSLRGQPCRAAMPYTNTPSP